MKQYASTLLVVISMFLGELHTFWEREPLRPQNWIYAVSREMPLQWNIKFAADQLAYLMIAIAFLLFVRNRVNMATATALTVFAVLNLGMYFYNYKTFGYGWLYIAFVIVWIIAFIRHKNSNLIK